MIKREVSKWTWSISPIWCQKKKIGIRVQESEVGDVIFTSLGMSSYALIQQTGSKYPKEEKYTYKKNKRGGFNRKLRLQS
jgi:hypothetical protein